MVCRGKRTDPEQGQGLGSRWFGGWGFRGDGALDRRLGLRVYGLKI